MKLIMDYKMAHAIGWDAGNASMEKAGRAKWNRTDYNVSVRTMNALLPNPEKAGT